MLCLPLNQPGFCATAPAASAGTSATNFDNTYPYPYNTHTLNTLTSTSSSTNTPSSLYSFPPPHHMSTYDSFSTPAASTPCSAIPTSRSWQPSSGNSTPTPLILDSLAASKVNMVENLVGTVV